MYKNKEDIQDSANYRRINLMSHIMKLYERMIEKRLIKETSASENQFGFMLGRSTMEVIHLLKRLIERHQEKKQDLHMLLHMFFIDFESTYDKALREIMWRVLEKKSVKVSHIEITKNIYENAMINVRTPE